MSEACKILVLGASGLIGRFVMDDLRARNFHVVGIARNFASGQKENSLDLELPVLSLDTVALARLFDGHGIELVVNCLGVLQDGPGSDTSAVHYDFVRGFCRRSMLAGKRSDRFTFRFPAAMRTILRSAGRNARPSG